MNNLTDTDFETKFLKLPNDNRDAPNLVVERPTSSEKGDPTDRPRAGSSLELSGVLRPSNVFRHQQAHPIVLDLLMSQKYGVEWLDWEAETIEYRVPRDFQSSVSLLNLSKLQAMRTLHMVDSFWQRWEIFCWCCMPMNDIFPDFETMQVPTVAQCMLAVDYANRTRDDMVWSDEIKAYLAAVHRHDDILVPQPPLDFVHVDTDGFPIDVQDIVKRWPDVRATGRAPTYQTVEDEQLRRMLDVNQMLESSRSRLREQLKQVVRV
jgi:hypothetical protein